MPGHKAGRRQIIGGLDFPTLVAVVQEDVAHKRPGYSRSGLALEQESAGARSREPAINGENAVIVPFDHVHRAMDSRTIRKVETYRIYPDGVLEEIRRQDISGSGLRPGVPVELLADQHSGFVVRQEDLASGIHKQSIRLWA